MTHHGGASARTRRTGPALLALLAAGSLALTSCGQNEGPDAASTPGASAQDSAANGADGHTGLTPPESSDSAAADPESTEGAAPSHPGAEPGAQSTLDPDTEVELAVVGDLMLSRDVGDRMQREGTAAVLDGVRDQLVDADLTVGNMESPLCTGGQQAPKRYLLKSDPVGLEVLQDGSFDVVSLANNHILDFGAECMDSTIDLLDGAGIAHAGAGTSIDAAREPVFVESNGMRIAFLSYLRMPIEAGGFDSQTWTATPDSPGVAWADPEVITEDVAAATPQADHVIVLLHSGWEKTDTLSPEQQESGNAALAAGATAVLGAHPHRLQAHHLADDGTFVAWSMGNFVFDYRNGTPESDSAVLHLTLGPDGVKKHEWTPVLIQDGFPVAVDPDEGEGARILNHLDAMSADYAASLG